MRRRDFLAGSATLVLAAATPAQADETAEAFHAARKFVDLPVGRIAYVEQGKGPVAIFLHGYPLNGFQWRGAMARLGTLRRCVAPDLMGLGYSEIARGTSLAPMAQSEMIIAFMDHLGIRQADFVSFDSATGIAQLIAANHPDRVRSLLLTNGDVDTNSPPPLLMPFIEKCRAGSPGDDWFKRHVADHAWARSNDGLGNAYGRPELGLSDENIGVYFGPLVASPVRLEQARRYAIDMLPNVLPPLAPKLRAYPGPVRMVWGQDVELFPDPWAVWLDKTFPKSRGIRFVPGAKLFFPEEQPELIAQEARILWES